MNKEGTKVSILTKSLINDLIVEINESESPNNELMLYKLKIIRHLVDAFIQEDKRITDDELIKILY